MPPIRDQVFAVTPAPLHLRTERLAHHATADVVHGHRRHERRVAPDVHHTQIGAAWCRANGGGRFGPVQWMVLDQHGAQRRQDRVEGKLLDGLEFEPEFGQRNDDAPGARGFADGAATADEQGGHGPIPYRGHVPWFARRSVSHAFVW